MFKEKAAVIPPKKENIVVNVVLKMWYSRRKNLITTKVWLVGKRRKNFNVCLNKLL
jgi:hypothetical protein